MMSPSFEKNLTPNASCPVPVDTSSTPTTVTCSKLRLPDASERTAATMGCSSYSADRSLPSMMVISPDQCHHEDNVENLNENEVLNVQDQPPQLEAMRKLKTDKDKDNLKTTSSSAHVRLVDYSHNRATLGRSSSYRIRRISRRTTEKTLTQPEAAATLRQERRMSALKAQKRRFSKAMDSSSNSGGAQAACSTMAMDLSSRSMSSHTCLSYGSYGGAYDDANGSNTEDGSPSELLQFALKRKSCKMRSASAHSLSPGPRRSRQSRLPRKSKSASDTIPRMPSRSSSRDHLSAGASLHYRAAGASANANDMPEQKDNLKTVSALPRSLCKSPMSVTVGSSINTGSATGSRTCTSSSKDDANTCANMTANATASRSSRSSKFGGVFKSMSLPKLKKYERLDDDDDEEEVDDEGLCLIQNLPASLRLPRVLRVCPDDASSVSSVSMEDCMYYNEGNDNDDDNDDDDVTVDHPEEEEEEEEEDESLACVWGNDRSALDLPGSSCFARERFLRRPSLSSHASSTCTRRSRSSSRRGSMTSLMSESLRSQSSRSLVRGGERGVRRRGSRRVARTGSGLNTSSPRTCGASSCLKSPRRSGTLSRTTAHQRRSTLLSHWASTSLLDSSRSSVGVGAGVSNFRERRCGEVTQRSLSNSDSYSGPALFPTKIRRYAPQQA